MLPFIPYPAGNEAALTVQASAPPAYTGPGDIVASAKAWWGLRAYSAATAGGNCVEIIRASDSTKQTFTTLEDGNIDLASITTFLTDTTGKITTLYDQTGNGFHLTPIFGDSLAPTFTPSGLGSLPVITMVPASNTKLLCAAFTLAQPFTMSIIYKQAATGSGSLIVSNEDATFPNLNVDNGGGGGSGRCVFTADNSSYAVVGVATGTVCAAQNVVNGASSSLNVNSLTPSTGSTGTTGLSKHIQVGNQYGANSCLPGFIAEAGIWPVAFTTTPTTGEVALMNANQHAYWGF